MSTKSNETTLRAMQMTTSDSPASPLRSFFHTCRSNSNTGLLVLFGVLFLTFSLYLPGRFATHDTLVSMMFQLPELGLLALAMLLPLLARSSGKSFSVRVFMEEKRVELTIPCKNRTNGKT